MKIAVLLDFCQNIGSEVESLACICNGDYKAFKHNDIATTLIYIEPSTAYPRNDYLL